VNSTPRSLPQRLHGFESRPHMASPPDRLRSVPSTLFTSRPSERPSAALAPAYGFPVAQLEPQPPCQKGGHCRLAQCAEANMWESLGSAIVRHGDRARSHGLVPSERCQPRSVRLTRKRCHDLYSLLLASLALERADLLRTRRTPRSRGALGEWRAPARQGAARACGTARAAFGARP